VGAAPGGSVTGGWDDEVPRPAIGDYALVGDCQTAALVSRQGSVDWLCLPRFDSGACFAALLGGPEHGRWRLAAVGPVERVERGYRGDTLVLDTTFHTPSGAVTVTDCMPPRTHVPDLVRVVTGVRGEVRMRMHLVIRFDYGSIVPWVRRLDGDTYAVAGPDTLRLQASVAPRGEGLATVAEFTVRAGQRERFVLTWHPTGAARPSRLDALGAVDDTLAWWEAWAKPAALPGPWRDAVVRSLITLKALTYAPSGGIVAAPTTSLPEQPGGVRNWDYRYCWVRDAAFTLHALMTNGFLDEARAWREWLVTAVAGAPAQIQIMYGVAGERRLPEMVLPWLPGHRGAAPVRIGNAAHVQRQLDIFGELAAVLSLAGEAGLPPADNAWRVQRELVEFLESVWAEPDEGIWEMRGPRRQFTHSKVMAWVALDRTIAAAERFGLPAPLARWRRVRAAIHAHVCRHGVDRRRGVFVQYEGGTAMDASLLRIPLVGFLPADDLRVRRTVETVRRELTEDGLLRRYLPDPDVDGLPAGEGLFLPCTFWLVDNLAMRGERAEACALFERLLALRNDVGLLSEEYDPRGRQLLGNFPQAFTHVSLINSAMGLATGAGACVPLGPADARRWDRRNETVPDRRTEDARAPGSPGARP